MMKILSLIPAFLAVHNDQQLNMQECSVLLLFAIYLLLLGK